MTRVLATPIGWSIARKRWAASLGIRLEFKPADLWVGLYWDHRWLRTFFDEPPRRTDELNAWLCIVPMLPIHVELKWTRYVKIQNAHLPE